MKLLTYVFLMLTCLTNWLVTAFNTLPVDLNYKMFVRLVPRRFLERLSGDKTSNGSKNVDNLYSVNTALNVASSKVITVIVAGLSPYTV